MRSTRLSLIFLAFYLVFIGGSAYYTLIFPVRVLHHGVMTALLVIWFIRRWRSGEGLPRTPLDLPLAAACGVWALTAFTSVDPRMAFENLWFVFLHLVLFYMLVDFFQRGRSKIIMEATFIIGALVVIITALEVASWYLGLGIIPGTEIGWINVSLIPPTLPRVALALNISTLLAGFTAPLIVLTIGWAMTARRQDYRRALWMLVGALAVVLFLTFSRGGLMSLGAGMAAIIAVEGVQRRVLSPLLVGIGIVVAAALFVFLFVISPDRTSGDAGRVDMYESAVEILADYPANGVGPGVFGRALRTYRTPEQARDKLASAHNAYLNTAAETGLLGLAVSAWLGVALVATWWQVWQRQDTPARKLRHMASIAALVGLAAHSLVDAFTVTPVVLVLLLAAAYSVTGHRTVLDDRPPGRRWPLVFGLLITAAFAVLLIQSDRAQAAYRGSFNGDLDAARQAEQIDPALNLYDLQIAYLIGEGDDTTAAIAAYEDALELEPTWDLGWANLGALYEVAGDYEAAVTALEQAYAINPLRTLYRIHSARIAEENGLYDAPTLQRMYDAAIVSSGRYLQSPFWSQTALRRDLIAAYISDDANPLDMRFRVAVAHDPAMVAALVPDSPDTAAAFWVAGEAARLNGDQVAARTFFDEAIARDSDNGDYYVSRARVQPDRDLAWADLDRAALLERRFESVDAVRAGWATTDNEANTYRISSVNAQSIVTQEFGAVLYGGRQTNFDLHPGLRGPAMWTTFEGWYDLAASYVTQGRIDEALTVYRAILRIDPFEVAAQSALADLDS